MLPLVSLVELKMSTINCSEQNLQELGKVPKGVTVLDCSDNRLTTLPAAIGNASDLEELLAFKNDLKVRLCVSNSNKWQDHLIDHLMLIIDAMGRRN